MPDGLDGLFNTTNFVLGVMAASNCSGVILKRALGVVSCGMRFRRVFYLYL